MKDVVLDFGTCSTEKEIHAYLKEQFGFPDYYGENLDALYDCLTDFTEDIEIHFKEPKGEKESKEPKPPKEEKAPKKPKEPMDEKIQQYLKKVRWVIGNAAEENGHLYL